MKLIPVYRAPHSRSKDRLIQIDNTDWPAVEKFRWCQIRTKRRDITGRLHNTHVAHRWVRDGSKRYGKVYLHRTLLEAGPTERVLHNDGNGLNCCRSNLRRVQV